LKESQYLRDGVYLIMESGIYKIELKDTMSEPILLKSRVCSGIYKIELKDGHGRRGAPRRVSRIYKIELKVKVYRFSYIRAILKYDARIYKIELKAQK
jgi:hypothetical protein